MAKQSLLWTVLPNGLIDDGKGIRVSVVLSPRLEFASGELPQLSSFRPEWLDWPATLAQATFEFTYGTAPPVSGPDDADRRREQGRPDAWEWPTRRPGLRSSTPTCSSAPAHTSTTRARTSSRTRQPISPTSSPTSTARSPSAADGDLPTVSDVLDAPGWDSLVADVDRIDERKNFDQDTGLRDTRRLFEEYREHRFEERKHRGGQGEPGFGGSPGSSSAGLLGRAQLFHTPPTRQVDVVRRPRNDDPGSKPAGASTRMIDLPAKDEFAKQLDFHQIVGAMSSYPTVLRRLGLVVDFVLERNHFSDSPDAPLSVAVTFEAGALGTDRKPDVSPVTHALLSQTAFEAVSDPLPGTDVRVPSRLLDLSPNQFALLQVDVDGAGLKVMNFARSLGRLALADERVDSVTRIERKVGAPALRTAGLMLVHRKRAAMLSDKFKANALKNASAQAVSDAAPSATPPDLYAQDILRGFRFDIWDETTRVWRSLCRRTAVYTLAPGFTVEPMAGEEEGFVRLATTKSPDPTVNPNLLWLHEAVVSWTGWSLCAPPPGRAILPDDSVGDEARTEAQLPPGLEFSSRLSAFPGSLPRLRYGRSYWLRARAVDLAGNSLDPQDDDFGPEQSGKQRASVPALRARRRAGRRARPAGGRNDRASGRGRVDAARRDPHLQRRTGRQQRPDHRDRPALRGTAAGKCPRGRAARDARCGRGGQLHDVRPAREPEGSRRDRPGGGARRGEDPDAGAARPGGGRARRSRCTATVTS